MLFYTSSNVTYLISCYLGKKQSISLVFKDNFKPRSRVRKSNVITAKVGCGVAKHFLTKCTDGNKLENTRE